MSNQNTPEDLQPAEDELLEMNSGAPARRQGMSVSTKFALIIGGGISAIALAMYFASPNQAPQTQLVAPPALDATPGGQNQATSPEFQESLRRENARRAALAEELGVTSMPTPEIILQPRHRTETVENLPEVERREVEAPPPPVQTASRRILPPPPATEQVVRQSEVQVSQSAGQGDQAQQVSGEGSDEENPYINAMISQMGMVSSRQTPIGMRSESIPGSDAGANGGDMPLQDITPPNEGEEADLLFRPGDILYGETLTSVSSDMQSPVMVEIVSGEQRGARLVGSFATDRRSASLVVNFTTMTLPDGTAIQINAYAVDGRSAETAVASDIERRYLQRYGPILASTFLSAFARAQATPDRIVSGGGYDIDVELIAPTLRQSAFAGLAAATDVISQDIMASAPQGPRINLRSGYPIAVLMVEPAWNQPITSVTQASEPAPAETN